MVLKWFVSIVFIFMIKNPRIVYRHKRALVRCSEGVKCSYFCCNLFWLHVYNIFRQIFYCKPQSHHTWAEKCGQWIFNWWRYMSKFRLKPQRTYYTSHSSSGFDASYHLRIEAGDRGAGRLLLAQTQLTVRSSESGDEMIIQIQPWSLTQPIPLLDGRAQAHQLQPNIMKVFTIHKMLLCVCKIIFASHNYFLLRTLFLLLVTLFQLVACSIMHVGVLTRFRISTFASPRCWGSLLSRQHEYLIVHELENCCVVRRPARCMEGAAPAHVWPSPCPRSPRISSRHNNITLYNRQTQAPAGWAANI